MPAAEILEWVTGWPWPVIILGVILIAGGIARILFRDDEDLPEHQSSGQLIDKKCVCSCE